MTDIGAARVTLTNDILQAIEEIHRLYTYPCP
jgi:hypothetical protein